MEPCHVEPFASGSLHPTSCSRTRRGVVPAAEPRSCGQSSLTRRESVVQSPSPTRRFSHGPRGWEHVVPSAQNSPGWGCGLCKHQSAPVSGWDAPEQEQDAPHSWGGSSARSLSLDVGSNAPPRSPGMPGPVGSGRRYPQCPASRGADPLQPRPEGPPRTVWLVGEVVFLEASGLQLRLCPTPPPRLLTWDRSPTSLSLTCKASIMAATCGGSKGLADGQRPSPARAPGSQPPTWSRQDTDVGPSPLRAPAPAATAVPTSFLRTV